MRAVRLALAAAVAAAASPALADPAQQWEAAYLALSAADAVETVSCLHAHKCEEANPLFGRHPSTLKLIAGKALLGAVHVALFDRMHDRNPKAALRYAQVSAGLQGGVVALNLRVFFR